jgi:hypothetical protein
LRRVDLIGHLRKQAYYLSRSDTFTPVSYWMSIPIRDLRGWIDAISEVRAEDKARKKS